ncbi:ABC transporter substrate-binding protein [Erysipelothrix rhusiopathiae]|uniref:ABC transporter substrate-binding protein n=1 Tax=Erysipelothrix rhusiopathiae TaxID=1648 RepID=UPI000F43645F|nr:ABC transporter substrate-binding protein [Erysipelothrix rhusiopathiae]AYV34025.1 extracellular solute-binding protein [Erysipelothrix rhusiopathiae]MDE8081629.1 ABC transporter substrate-binding protein [Erysipelothrix rhusiopathiae]MDE8276510.1 ABC transporter substrate-binding protein [Erysipelothrix rhusiopathiae]MDE8328852.1 ABC transporter substrate-binding protein [Erysipelothrix rhusiopathiae]MDE8332164.1 ABC transporter substrate-binding protein [Erysipelothrix rhusiopathiae]
MKKVLVALLASLLVLTGCGAKETKEELRVYNWGEYIDESLIPEFENKYNVRVIYEKFLSNEQMYNKLQDGSKFDVIVPSDYTTQRMREEGMLQKIDYSKITNYENIIPSLKGRHMDPNNEYSVPYFWGNVGILYNKNTVDRNDLETQGWNILMNEKYKGKLFFYDSERDAFMIALKAQGFSMNTTKEDELKKANDWLIEMKQTMDPVYGTDEIIDQMIGGAKDIAVMYSGDANAILLENPDMDFYSPSEGTNTWVDAMVIPNDAPNPDLAHKWIDFMISEEVSKRITEEIGYTSPIQSVIDDVTGPDGAFNGIDSYVTRTGYDKDEEFFYDQEMKVILSDYWQRIKATK